MTDLLRPAWRFLRSLWSTRRPAPEQRLRLEELETRTLLSVAVVTPNFQMTPLAAAASAPYSPGQVRAAYGFSKVPYDGTGQTIAIVDAYDDPTIQADLTTFDQTFGVAAPPSFTKMEEVENSAQAPTFVKAPAKGGPASDPTWAGEISLDVEWAHAIAPKANILLVETASAQGADLMAGVNYARNQPGVAVVSMSWGAAEFSGEASYDATFTTPAGHNGVVFVAAAGDNGAGAEWPSVSPNVLGVGGTTLTITPAGAYVGETAWADGGGGPSVYETEPAFQQTVQHTGKRDTPDVAYDADPNTGFYVYDSTPQLDGAKGWFAYGGTSAGTPQWAALIALADQGRAAVGLGALANGPSVLYTLSASDFHDVTTGSNGARAGAGYDMVTGLGSPYADRIVAGLVAYAAASTSAKGSPAKPAATTTSPPKAAAKDATAAVTTPRPAPLTEETSGDLLPRAPRPSDDADWDVF